ncbi:MAG: hypothetical protein U0401_36005 [Anaerolineae bacterium]
MLTKIDWEGWSAWQLENNSLRVVIIPQLGAKIVSFFDKQAQHEWLAKPRRPLRAAPYNASFVDYDLSGWDEMCPTIIACHYPAPGPFQGRMLPDHGEVWALPWSVEAANEMVLSLSVQGQALPYRLKRAAKFTSSGTLCLDYELFNQGRDSLAYLWAAHPLFAVDRHTRIVLPPEVNELYNVLIQSPWGEAGARYPWPVAKDETGSLWQLDRVGPVSNRDCRKFYVPPETPINWVKLEQTHSGNWLQLAWSSAQIPFMGLWIDEGAYSAEPAVAPEPASAFYDSLVTAWELQQVSVLAPGTVHTWQVSAQIGLDE